MQNLKGKNILIGKEPGSGRLLVAIEGTQFNTAIGPANSVPSTVSRCMPTQGAAHARISIDTAGNMLLTNLKPQNVTFVNGTRVLSKHIDSNTAIELGSDHFSVNMTAILATARRLVTPITQANPPIVPRTSAPSMPGVKIASKPEQNTFSTKPLEEIWMRYENEMDRIQARQKRTNTMRALQGVLSLGGIVVGGVMAMCGAPAVGIIFSSAALVLGIVAFFVTKNDTSAEDRKRALEQLEDNYLCPNPACRKSLPTKPYKWIQRNYTNCSYCKSKLIH